MKVTLAAGATVAVFVGPGVFVIVGVLVIVGVFVIVDVGVGVHVGCCPVPHPGAAGTTPDVDVGVRFGFWLAAGASEAVVGVDVAVEAPVPLVRAQSSRAGAVPPVVLDVSGVRVAVPTGVRVGVPLACTTLAAELVGLPDEVTVTRSETASREYPSLANSRNS